MHVCLNSMCCIYIYIFRKLFGKTFSMLYQLNDQHSVNRLYSMSIPHSLIDIHVLLNIVNKIHPCFQLTPFKILLLFILSIFFKSGTHKYISLPRTIQEISDFGSTLTKAGYKNQQQQLGTPRSKQVNIWQPSLLEQDAHQCRVKEKEGYIQNNISTTCHQLTHKMKK